MGLFVQLKQAKDAEVSLVGLAAKERAKLQNVIAQPFSLVLTSSMIARICEAAQLQEYFSRLPEAVQEQVQLFSEVTERLKKAKPQQEVMESLRESFELITLDTADLKSLSQLPLQKSILGIIPSPTYLYGESQGQRLFISGDTFETFFEQIKVTIGSFFTPQAIQFRLQKQIREWSLACVCFRLPNIHTCFTLQRKGQESKVESYVGLPDIRKEVTKDEFIISGEIPNIVNRTIREQKTVCVYALDRNQVVSKDYITTSTALQSAPDYDVQEVSRLAKKIMQEWGVQEVQALFAKPKQGTVVLLDAYSVPETMQETPAGTSPQEQKLATTQAIADHLPHLEQAIKEDNHHSMHQLVETIKEKLHHLLHK